MKDKKEKLIFLLRIALGWLFFYAGYTKVINPDWTSKGYISTAKTFPELYNWLGSPGVLPVVDFLVQWGLLLLGLSLIFGLLLRLSTVLGAVLMFLLYLPILAFPKVGSHSYIVDEHIIYALVLLLLGYLDAGQYKGLSRRCRDWKELKKYPKLLKWL